MIKMARVPSWCKSYFWLFRIALPSLYHLMLTSGFDNSQLRLMSCPAADVLSSSCFVTSVGFSEEEGGKKKGNFEYKS